VTLACNGVLNIIFLINMFAFKDSSDEEEVLADK